MPMFDSLDELYAAAAKDSSIIQAILSPNPIAELQKINITFAPSNLPNSPQNLVVQLAAALNQYAKQPVTPEMLTMLAGLLSHPDQLRAVQLLDKADILTNNNLQNFAPSTYSAY